MPGAEPDPPAQLRIASFKVRSLQLAKLQQPRLLNVLGDVVTNFDLLALEGLDPNCQEVLHTLVDAANAHSRHYDFVLGPAGSGGAKTRAAFLFDADRVEIDRSAACTQSTIPTICWAGIRWWVGFAPRAWRVRRRSPSR